MTPESLLELVLHSPDIATTTFHPALAEVEFRRRVYELIHPDPSAAHHDLLRAAFEQEIRFRDDLWHGRAEDPEDDFENIYWCALFLYMLGDPSDVALLWRAKRLNMDVGSGLDVQFLAGAGVDRTLGYLDTVAEGWAIEASEYLTECARAGDFDDLAGWKTGRVKYFSPSDSSPSED